MKKNILVVENNSEVIDQINRFLHYDFFDVTIAGDQTVARILLSKKTFDMVVTASLLPKSHGFTLCKFIKETYPSIKNFILFDKLEAEDYQREAYASGASEILVKPLKEGIFRQKVMQHLGMDESSLFGRSAGDSTNLMVLPLLEEISKQAKNDLEQVNDDFDDIIDDVELENDPYEIKLD